jgi:predicted AlkP superfamily pyrophosphatase or phosphodiesterase
VADDATTELAETPREWRGASAANMLVPSCAEVIHERLDGRSRSLGVSIKDRGAVLGVGDHGQAYWYKSGTGLFVTSTAYRQAAADWWLRFYEGEAATEYAGRRRVEEDGCQRRWHGEHERSLADLDSSDVRFSHPDALPVQTDRAFFRGLRQSYWGDRATYDFLVAAREALELGESTQRTDSMFVSFSACDYVNHGLGPDSPAATSVVREIDRLLVRLFSLLDTEVGEGRWVLAFTADHGFPTTPEVARLRGEDSGRLDPKAMAWAVDARLDELHGDGEWVIGWTTPTFYLDRELVDARGLDFSMVQSEAKVVLEALDGVHAVATRHEIQSKTYGGPFADAVARAFHPDRSGDLLVLQERNWYLLRDPNSLACTHGSPWEYDREVPLFFLGGPVNAGRFDRDAEIRDLAPTLLALLGQEPASSMSGKVLGEVLRD